MGFVAHSPPNIAAALTSYGQALGTGPVVKSAFVPQTLANKVCRISFRLRVYFSTSSGQWYHEHGLCLRRRHDIPGIHGRDETSHGLLEGNGKHIQAVSHLIHTFIHT